MTTSATTSNNDEPGKIGLKTSTLAGSVVLLLSFTVIQRGMGFVREMLFCRWLDEGQLGQWAMVLVFLSSASAIATFGFQGSLSRYVAHQRKRGQLKSYLFRIGAVSLSLSIVASSTLWWFRETFSDLVFGSPDHTDLIGLAAFGLTAVIANNFFSELFTALRLFRQVAILQVISSFLFVTVSVSLLTMIGPTASTILWAYSLAFGVAFFVMCVPCIRVWRELPTDQPPEQGTSFWPRIVRFSLFLWTYNCLANLFGATDRYMIIHFSTMDQATALAAVGNYYSARVVPLLLTTVAFMIGSALTPHFSHEWEAGRRAIVGRKVVLAIKLLSLALSSAGVVVLVASPFLFEFAFAGKYAGGLSIMPLVLVTCIFCGLRAVAVNHLWCSEKLSLCSVALAISLATNIGLNFVLLPIFGLLGAVIATAAAHLCELGLLLWFSYQNRLPVRPGLIVISLVPLALAAGPLVGAAVLLIVFLWATQNDFLLNRYEKALIQRTFRVVAQKVPLIMNQQKPITH